MGSNKHILNLFKSKLDGQKTTLGIQKVYLAPSTDHIHDLASQLPCVVISDVDYDMDSLGSGAYQYEASIDVTVIGGFELDQDDVLTGFGDLVNDIQNTIEDVTDSQHIVQNIMTESKRASADGTVMRSVISTTFDVVGIPYKNH